MKKKTQEREPIRTGISPGEWSISGSMIVSPQGNVFQVQKLDDHIDGSAADNALAASAIPEMVHLVQVLDGLSKREIERPLPKRSGFNELEKALVAAREKLRSVPAVSVVDARQCALMLTEIVEEIMPQMGRLVLQDYGKLNQALVMSEKLFGRRRKKNEQAKAHA